MSVVIGKGRFGNILIQNLAMNFIAKKHNLFVTYHDPQLYVELGLDLFVGENKYEETKELTENNYFDILNSPSISFNLKTSMIDYYQTSEICNHIYKYFREDTIKEKIIMKNIFKSRLNNNNDCFIHVRLDDVAKFNPGPNYYFNCLDRFNIEKIYLSSDNPNHEIINKIRERYPQIEIFYSDEIKTIQFASTCKNIVLSHGSFSATMGYLAYYSNVYYPKFNEIWHGDIFSIAGWNLVGY